MRIPQTASLLLRRISCIFFKQKNKKKIKKVRCVTKVPTVLINVEFLEGGGEKAG